LPHAHITRLRQRST